MKKDHIIKSIINIILSILFISVFIVVFFFSYVQLVEKEIIIQQSSFLADIYLENIVEFLSPEQKKKVSSYLDDLDINTENDAAIKKQNKKILKRTIIIVSIFISILISSIIFLKYYYKVPIKGIIFKNIIILFFIFITEFSFLNIISKNYISFDPNYIRYVTADVLNNFVNENSNKNQMTTPIES